MKKSLFLSVMAIFVACGLFAQTTISNPGFEQWSNSTTPQDWTTSISGTINYSVAGFPIPIPISLDFGERTTDAHSGNYALKLNASELSIAQLAGINVTIPGIAQLGTSGSFSIDYETIAALMDTSSTGEVDWSQILSVLNCVSHGVPFSQVPSRMNAWIKYQPAEGVTDTMTVLVFAYSGGSIMDIIMGDEDAAAAGYYQNSTRYNDWTQISVDIESLGESTQCDSLAIFILSSSFQNAKASTTLYIDDISFEYGTSVASTEKPEFSVYPNPTTDYLNIAPANQSEMFDLQIVDQTGRVVKNMTSLEGNTQVNVQGLAAGFYFVKIMQAGQQVVRNFVVK